MACPYGARYFQDEERDYFGTRRANEYEQQAYAAHERGVVEKCDFCRSRLERGEEPACSANCMCKARIFGDLDDPRERGEPPDSRGRGRQLNPELGTDPSVYYLPPER